MGQYKIVDLYMWAVQNIKPKVKTFYLLKTYIIIETPKYQTYESFEIENQNFPLNASYTG